MQIYRGMNIGTAKVKPNEEEGIAHHLLDVVEPGVSFSVAEYKEMAEGKIEDIYERGKFPIVVGGTGLYIKALVYDIDMPGTGADEKIRQRLNDEAKQYGKTYLYNKLMKIDPDSAKKIHENDLRRVIRSLEVYYSTGVPISKQQRGWNNLSSTYNLAAIGLTMDREKLYERINARVDQQIKDGLIDEVKDLMKRGFTNSLTSMQAIGYKEIIPYLEGHCTLDEAVNKLKMNTRRYAKRQITWFNKEPSLNWIHIDKYSSFEDIIQEAEVIIESIIDY